MVNVTDALWPFAAAVTVAVAGVLMLTVPGGRYVVWRPRESESEPGPASVQVASPEVAVITVGPLMLWGPEGEMLSGGDPLPQVQSPAARNTIAAKGSLRIALSPRTVGHRLYHAASLQLLRRALGKPSWHLR